MHRPLRIAVQVAAVARVGNAQLDAQSGVGDAKAVVVPVIHHHVVARGHVAIYTGRARALGLVPMMGLGVKYRGRMAARAERVAFGAQRGAVRFVTVGADHSRRVHTALQKGTVNIHFLKDLAVGEVQSGLDQGQAVEVPEKGLGIMVIEFAASRMAGGTGR